MALFRRLANDETGATAVEYAVMLALILAVIISAVTILGTTTATSWTTTNQEMIRHGVGP